MKNSNRHQKSIFAQVVDFIQVAFLAKGQTYWHLWSDVIIYMFLWQFLIPSQGWHLWAAGWGVALLLMSFATWHEVKRRRNRTNVSQSRLPMAAMVSRFLLDTFAGKEDYYWHKVTDYVVRTIILFLWFTPQNFAFWAFLAALTIGFIGDTRHEIKRRKRCHSCL